MTHSISWRNYADLGDAWVMSSMKIFDDLGTQSSLIYQPRCITCPWAPALNDHLVTHRVVQGWFSSTPSSQGELVLGFFRTQEIPTVLSLRWLGGPNNWMLRIQSHLFHQLLHIKEKMLLQSSGLGTLFIFNTFRGCQLGQDPFSSS